MWSKAPSLSARMYASLEELWLAMFSWIPTPLGLLLRWFFWRWIFFKCGFVRFESGSSFSHCRNIQLGKGVRIAKGCFVSAGHGKLVIGNDTSISSAVHLGADEGVINIGSQVGIGPGTVIRAANHRFVEKDVPFLLQGHESGRIDIEDDVWIGANCVITPDVRIGRGAVVGAGAVVTHDVAPFSIVAGVPAKIIGMRNGHRA